MIENAATITGFTLFAIVALTLIVILANVIWGIRHCFRFYFLMLKVLKRFPESNIAGHLKLIKYCFFSKRAIDIALMYSGSSLSGEHFYFSTSKAYVKGKLL